MKKAKNETVSSVLSFEDFINVFRKELQSGRQNLKEYTIEEDMINKNGKMLHGIIVRKKDNNIAPVFYYEDFYDSYSKGKSIDDCIREIEAFMSINRIPGEDMSRKISNWEKAKDLLVIKMINAERNAVLLKSVLHKYIGDMAIIVQIHLKSEMLGTGAVTVDKELCKHWKVDPETVMNKAFDNMLRYKVLIKDMRDFAKDKESVPDDAPGMFVLQYDMDYYGASAVLRTQELKQFACIQDTNFFVLPVCTSEMLLIEDNGDISKEFLYDFLNNINIDHPTRDSMLSKQVFYLDRNLDELRYLSDGRKLCVFS